MAWGYHLVLDYGGCPKDRLTDGELIKTWVKTLVEKIDMTAFGEPILEHFAAHSEDCAGYSLVQLIETSNICAHFAENKGEVYIDIFSCKSFNPDLASEVCSDFFQPSKVNSQFFERG